MVVPTRLFMNDAGGNYVSNECTVNGLGAGGTGLSCIPSTKNRSLNAGFFDGHAKNLNGPSTIQNDNWDAYATYGYNKAYDLGQAQNIKEWKQ